MNYPLIVGILGASTILVAFILNELHRLSTDSLIYDLLNMLGALCLAIYAYLLGSIPFLVLNGIWTLVAARDVYKTLMHRSVVS